MSETVNTYVVGRLFVGGGFGPARAYRLITEARRAAMDIARAGGTTLVARSTWTGSPARLLADALNSSPSVEDGEWLELWTTGAMDASSPAGMRWEPVQVWDGDMDELEELLVAMFGPDAEVVRSGMAPVGVHE